MCTFSYFIVRIIILGQSLHFCRPRQNIKTSLLLGHRQTRYFLRFFGSLNQLHNRPYGMDFREATNVDCVCIRSPVFSRLVCYQLKPSPFVDRVRAYINIPLVFISSTPTMIETNSITFCSPEFLALWLTAESRFTLGRAHSCCCCNVRAPSFSTPFWRQRNLSIPRYIKKSSIRRLLPRYHLYHVRISCTFNKMHNEEESFLTPVPVIHCLVDATSFGASKS